MRYFFTFSVDRGKIWTKYCASSTHDRSTALSFLRCSSSERVRSPGLGRRGPILRAHLRDEKPERGFVAVLVRCQSPATATIGRMVLRSRGLYLARNGLLREVSQGPAMVRRVGLRVAHRNQV